MMLRPSMNYNFHDCSFPQLQPFLAVMARFFGDLDQASVPSCAMTGAVLDGSEEGQKLAAQTREALKRKRQALEDGKTEDGEDKASRTGNVLLSRYPVASGTEHARALHACQDCRTGFTFNAWLSK